MNTKFDKGQATRHQIIETATRLYSENGYENTSIDLVLKTCGISRGALYHHFSSKEALFAAVLEVMEAQIAEKVGAAAKHATNPLDALRAGCNAWLELAQDKNVRQIVLIDAPSIVGWQTWREMDGKYSLGLLKSALNAAVAMGRFREDRVDLHAHVLLAMLTEVAMLIARTDQSSVLTQSGKEAVEQHLSSLFGLEPNASW
jgi:AcrR family transcriptional regulator